MNLLTPASAPRAPNGLKRAGKGFWKKVVRAYELEDHHLALLEAACRTLDDLTTAEQTLAEQGRYFLDRYNQWKEHPAAGDAKQLRRLFTLTLRELGLDVQTPDSRPPRYGG